MNQTLEAPASVIPIPSVSPAPVPVIVSSQRFPISADKLNLSGLDPEQEDVSRWFWKYCADRNLAPEQVSALVPKIRGKGTYDFNSVLQLLTGRRVADGVNLDPMCEALAAFRSRVQAREAVHGFIETRLFKRLEKYKDEVRAAHLCGFVFGNFTVGKTTCFEEMERRDPKVTVVRMRTRGRLNEFVKVLARKRAMGDRSAGADLEMDLCDSFGEDEVLIVDEADQCFTQTRMMSGLHTLNFLRELWDRARCGIIFVMDNAGRDMLTGKGRKKVLGRLWRRRVPALQLPDVPYAEDCDAFAAKFGLPPATEKEITVRATVADQATGEDREVERKASPLELQRQVLRDEGGGLIVWLGILADARDMARRAKKEITWGAVIKAHAARFESEASK